MPSGSGWMVPPLENLPPMEVRKAAAALLGAANAGFAASEDSGTLLSAEGFAMTNPCRTVE